MSDKLTTRDGRTIEIERMIAALEATPDAGEIREALEQLRRDKLKAAVGETVRAARFDRDHVFAEFLADGEKSAKTVDTYRRECRRLFGWIDRQGLATTTLRRADVNRFKAYLSERYAANTVRVTLAACSSWYSYLEAERVIESSPFARVTYPRREFKKAQRPDSRRPEVVPGAEEYERIALMLWSRTQREGGRAPDRNARESAKRTLLALHLMRFYGLRISSVLSVEFLPEERIAYTLKGGARKQRKIFPHTRTLREALGAGSRPFRGVGKSTLQNALRRATLELAGRGAIRRAYSAHDFRHLRALELYRERGSVYEVMSELDHSSVTATQTYLAGLGAEQ